MVHRRTLHLFSLTAAAALLTLATTSLAAPLTQPLGLNPGDEYRLVFVTSTLTNATSSNIADYNAFVTAAANLSPELVALGTTWTAIASTQSVDARDNSGTNFNITLGTAIYRLDGSLVANDNFDLWDGSIGASISLDEAGIEHTSFVWTGTDPATGLAYAAFALGNGSGNASLGLSSATATAWVDSALAPTSGNNRVYAISDVLVAVPEPGSAALLSLGLMALVARRRASIV